MGIIGKAVHYSVDLILVSTVLAGIKRNTGLTPKTDFVPNKEVEQYVKKYFAAGEYVYDSTVGIINTSSYFERR